MSQLAQRNEALDFGILSTGFCPKEEPKNKIKMGQDQEEVSPLQPLRFRKRLQRMRSNEEKLKVIERIRQGESKAAVGRDLNVPESTIRGWCKSENIISRSPQMKSPHDGDTHTTSSMKYVAKWNDEGNYPDLKESERAVKRQKLDVEPEAVANPSGGSNAQNIMESMWNWIIFHQQIMLQFRYGQMGCGNWNPTQQIPLQSIRSDEDNSKLEKLQNTKDAINHGEMFFQWLEDFENPVVNKNKVIPLRKMLDNLKQRLEKIA